MKGKIVDFRVGLLAENGNQGLIIFFEVFDVREIRSFHGDLLAVFGNKCFEVFLVIFDYFPHLIGR